MERHRFGARKSAPRRGLRLGKIKSIEMHLAPRKLDLYRCDGLAHMKKFRLINAPAGKGRKYLPEISEDGGSFSPRREIFCTISRLSEHEIISARARSRAPLTGERPACLCYGRPSRPAVIDTAGPMFIPCYIRHVYRASWWLASRGTYASSPVTISKNTRAARFRRAKPRRSYRSRAFRFLKGSLRLEIIRTAVSAMRRR